MKDYNGDLQKSSMMPTEFKKNSKKKLKEYKDIIEDLDKTYIKYIANE